MISSLDRDHRLQQLHRLTMQVGAAGDMVDALQAVVALVHENGALMVHVCLLTTDDGCPRCRSAAKRGGAAMERRLHFVARAGTPMEPDSAHIFPTGWGMVDQVVRTQRPLRLIHNVDAIVREEMLETPRRFPEFGLRVEDVQRYLQSQIQSVAFFPLIVRETLLGVLCSSFSREVDDDEYTWLALCANQAAVAVERGQLRDKLRQLQTVRPTPPTSLALVDSHKSHAEMIGCSLAFRELRDTIDRAAATDSTVLITGETGTGKELVAREIHRLSARRRHPLVTLNCGAVAPSLIESELFGHERGAFTGALQRRLGRFEMAHHGTLLLDELSELALDGQVKLLRVLQEREFERVGSSQSVRVDFRLIAASNRDLEREVAAGRFREDLLYRINVLAVRVPSLRDRRDDIPLFVEEFIEYFRRTSGTLARGIAPDALDALLRFDWPGNVRELRNVIERACVLVRGMRIELDDVRLPPRAELRRRHGLANGNGRHGGIDGDALATDLPSADAQVNGDAHVHTEALTTFEENERRYLQRVLASTNGRVDGPRGAAAILAMNPSTLRSRLHRLGISRLGNTAS